MVVPDSLTYDINDDNVSALSRWLDGAPGRSPNDYDSGIGSGWPFSLLMICAESYASDCVRYLISRGADVNERNPNPDTSWGQTDEPSLITALLIAVEDSGLDMVELLIEAGADVDARMYNGHTPLTTVLLSKRQGEKYPIVEALLRAGASIDKESLIEGTFRNQTDVGCVLLLRDVRAAGSWKRYILSPHMQILRLRSLVARGRASARPGARRSRRCVAKLISPDLCNEVVWECLSYWLGTR
mmetsp:Transcript_13080/g.40335  ORF Transcript_13080/g.40335 Transcript_13080/m.40335 type:complete len:243 (+) Transcript_13080:176-904(+)